MKQTEQLQSILIDLENGALDKYAAFDLIKTLFAQENNTLGIGDVRLSLPDYSELHKIANIELVGFDIIKKQCFVDGAMMIIKKIKGNEA